MSDTWRRPPDTCPVPDCGAAVVFRISAWYCAEGHEGNTARDFPVTQEERNEFNGRI